MMISQYSHDKKSKTVIRTSPMNNDDPNQEDDDDDNDDDDIAFHDRE